jgi:hypothetical protein
MSIGAGRAGHSIALTVGPCDVRVRHSVAQRTSIGECAIALSTQPNLRVRSAVEPMSMGVAVGQGMITRRAVHPVVQTANFAMATIGAVGVSDTGRRSGASFSSPRCVRVRWEYPM